MGHDQAMQQKQKNLFETGNRNRFETEKTENLFLFEYQKQQVQKSVFLFESVWELHWCRLLLRSYFSIKNYYFCMGQHKLRILDGLISLYDIIREKKSSTIQFYVK